MQFFGLPEKFIIFRICIENNVHYVVFIHILGKRKWTSMSQHVLFLCLFVCFFVHCFPLSFSFYVSLCLSILLSVSVFHCLCLSLSVCLSIFLLPILLTSLFFFLCLSFTFVSTNSLPISFDFVILCLSISLFIS